MLIQSVDRAMKILLSIAERPEGFGVRELARQHGLTPPTTQNMLQTLAHHGLVRFDSVNKRYKLGPSAVQLGSGYDELNVLHQLVHPHLVQLTRDDPCHCAAAIMHQGDVVLVDAQLDSVTGFGQPFRPYIAYSAHMMAVGLVLLAELDLDARRAYYDRVEATQQSSYPLDRERVEREIAEIQERGYALRRPNPETDSLAVGLGVPDPQGCHTLALGASQQYGGNDEQQGQRLIVRLQAAAAAITADWYGRKEQG